MSLVKIKVGPLHLSAALQTDLAPATCQAFLKLLPFRQKLIQARWSGESGWVPLGNLKLDVEAENQKTRPAAGELLFYAGGISETEILFPYGQTVFACKAGPLSGNHFLTVTDDRERLAELGQLILWKGAQEILFEVG